MGREADHGLLSSYSLLDDQRLVCVVRVDAMQPRRASSVLCGGETPRGAASRRLVLSAGPRWPLLLCIRTRDTFVPRDQSCCRAIARVARAAPAGGGTSRMAG